MPLITTIEELKEVTGLGHGNRIEQYQADIEEAEIDYLIPVLGDETYEMALAVYEAPHTVLPEDIALYAPLLPLSRRIVGNLAVASNLDLLQVQITEAGITRLEENGEKSAYHYQKKEAQNYFSRRGFRAIEQLLSYLEKKQDVYADWKESDAFSQNFSLLIPSATEFQKHYNINSSRRTYLALQTILRRVENFRIKEIIGLAMYQSLMHSIRNDAEPPQTGAVKADNAYLLDNFIRPALAHLAIAQAVFELNLSISATGVHVSEELSTMDKGEQKRQPSKIDVALIAEKCERFGDLYLSNMKKYLLEASSDTRYPEYYALINIVSRPLDDGPLMGKIYGM